MVGVALAGILMGAVVIYAMRNQEALVERFDQIVGTLVEASLPDDAERVQMSIPVCGSRHQTNCVVDGDTIRLDGERIRLLAIDAPELFSPQCAAEYQLAIHARDRLADVLSAEPWRVVRDGTDRYGRTLAKLRLERGWAGTVLVREGFAVWWDDRRRWC